MPRPQASRPTYSSQQLEQYFEYISFPSTTRVTPEDANDSKKGLEFLSSLLKYQLAHVPFENLDLHYSTHHTITLDIDHLFHKIVERANGRGGYCMENNLFFGTVLRSLGYQVLPVGVRVNSCADEKDDTKIDESTYSGLSHTVNIITIAGTKYFVDVGFGSRGPTSPILLEDGISGRNTGDDKKGGTLFRLSRGHMAENTHSGPEQLLWIYSIRFNEKMNFMPMYCFAELEFLPQDFRVMSFHVSQNKTSWFTQSIVCQKFLLDENENVVGDITLADRVVKERRYGQGKTLAEIKTEAERVTALEQFLGIKLAKTEANGIAKLVSQIRS